MKSLRGAVGVFVLLAIFLSGPSPAGALGGAWTITSTSAPYVSSLRSVSCPSSSNCDAIGTAGASSVVEATTNGGKTWSVVASMPPTVTLASIACTTASSCVAIDTSNPDIVSTLNGWGTFSIKRAPPPVQALDTLNCVPSGVCAITGTDYFSATFLLTSTAPGVRWTAHSIPEDSPLAVGVIYPPAAACATVTTCVVFGYTASKPVSLESPTPPAIFRTSDGGRRWSTEQFPAGTVAIDAFDCPTPTRCDAVGLASGRGSVAFSSSNAGATWQRTLDWPNVTLGEISCPSALTCVALGASHGEGVAARTTDGGLAWFSNELSGFGSDVSCGTADSCTVVGQFGGAVQIEGSSDGGRTWSPLDVVTPPALPNVVACPVSGTCELLGSMWTGSSYGPYAARSTNGGVTWADQALPSNLEDVGNLACPTASTCAATGYNTISKAPVFVATTDGGTSWSATALPQGVKFATAIACPTATECVLVGGAYASYEISTQILHTSDLGATWTTGALPAPPNGDPTSWYAVSCPTALDCEVAGALGYAGFGIASFLTTTDGGATWSESTVDLPGETGVTDQVQSIGCVSASECIGVGENYNPFTAGYTGISWSNQEVAVMATSDGGGTWSDRFSIGAGTTYTSNPTCSASGCLLIGTSPSLERSYGLFTGDDGASWTLSGVPSSWLLSWSVSCATTTSCVMLGYTKNGSIAIAALS
jgi:hypothetical protein